MVKYHIPLNMFEINFELYSPLGEIFCYFKKIFVDNLYITFEHLENCLIEGYSIPSYTYITDLI